MGRNLSDFYADGEKASAVGPEGNAVISRSSVMPKDLVATADSGNREVRRKVTKNKDVKKQGARLAEVAVGNKKPAKKDKVTGNR